MAEQAQCVITVEEAHIPIREEVRGFCEILGLDPLFLANEGKMVVFCAAADAENVLASMQAHEYGKDAAMIGRVQEKDVGALSSIRPSAAPGRLTNPLENWCQESVKQMQVRLPLPPPSIFCDRIIP